MTKLVAVRYEKGKISYFLPPQGNVSISKGDQVLVETDRGLQVGIVVHGEREYTKENIPDKIFKIVRLMTIEDRKKHDKNMKECKGALIKAKEYAKELKLDMHFVDCFYTFDRNQLIFTFVADNRIDFRDLAKKLAQIYRTRIELRQVGVRDKAKDVGGLGPCGRFLCCSTFLTDFDSVSINMAKNQYIALNPAKINGVCGRLLCCLKYEDQQYSEMKKGVPKIGQVVEVDGIKGKVSSINLFTEKMVIEQSNKTFVEVNLVRNYGSSK